MDKVKAALTELFNGVRNSKTPIIVERIVAYIDDIVETVALKAGKAQLQDNRKQRKHLEVLCG